MKNADDSVIDSLPQNSEIEHGPLDNDWVNWCESHLRLNIFKTKGMIIDFRRKPHTPQVPPTKAEIVQCRVL